ncbi:MAG: hypothetical protein Ct9H300mP15_19530 [Gemmatimonadota bacterium]|nr:MAG: hypothetical protein Ct9H300mP15_19530 [Gemmatimonadota bacterium]
MANRGEIAVRIIRSARERGIRAIAVYSEPDRLAPHVLAADEAYHIGPAPSSESYLRTEGLIEVAKATEQTRYILVTGSFPNVLHLQKRWKMRGSSSLDLLPKLLR